MHVLTKCLNTSLFLLSQPFRAPVNYYRCIGGIFFLHRITSLSPLVSFIRIEVWPLILSLFLLVFAFMYSLIEPFAFRCCTSCSKDMKRLSRCLRERLFRHSCFRKFLPQHQTTTCCSNCEKTHINRPSLFPLYAHLTHAWAHFLFIVIGLTRAGFRPTDSRACALDIVISVYFLAFLVSKIEQIYFQMKMSETNWGNKIYFIDCCPNLGSLVDIVALFLLAAYLATRLFGFINNDDEANYVAEFLLAFSGLIYVLRLLSYSTFHHKLAPIIHAVMTIAVDGLLFAYVIVVFQIAFSFHLACTYNAVFYKAQFTNGTFNGSDTVVSLSK